MVDMTYREFIREALISDIEVIVSYENGDEKYFTTGIILDKWFALVKTDDIEILMLSKINLADKVNLEEIKNNIEGCTKVELYIPKWMPKDEAELWE